MIRYFDEKKSDKFNKQLKLVPERKKNIFIKHKTSLLNSKSEKKTYVLFNLRKNNEQPTLRCLMYIVLKIKYNPEILSFQMTSSVLIFYEKSFFNIFKV